MPNRYYKPILLNPDEDLRKWIEAKAKEQDRKLGPTVVFMLKQARAAETVRK